MLVFLAISKTSDYLNAHPAVMIRAFPRLNDRPVRNRFTVLGYFPEPF